MRPVCGGAGEKKEDSNRKQVETPHSKHMGLRTTEIKLKNYGRGGMQASDLETLRHALKPASMGKGIYYQPARKNWERK